MKNIYRIVLTGGPCSGKSTMLRNVREHFSKLGFRVLTVSETATDLLSSGISPFNMDNVTFQYIVTSTMRFKESMMCLAADTVPEENVIILHDRAQMDNTAYMTEAEYAELLTRMNTSRVAMRDGYDAIFHLATTAKQSCELYERYSRSNNARYETCEEAIEVDNRLLCGWTGHSHLRIIPPNDDFSIKFTNLAAEIEHVVLDKTETERAFLIELPTKEELMALPFCRAVEIEQCYLEKAGMNLRARKRGENGSYVYFLTEKSAMHGAVRAEAERRITKDEYDSIRAKSAAVLTKTRYCICDKYRYFELDVYPFSEKYARLELELLDENEVFDLPNFVHVVCEVTNDNRYSNHALAERLRFPD